MAGCCGGRGRRMSRDLFGHPRGLTILFGTEMWERFSYYGMRALLVYYLAKYLLLPGHVEHVLFYPQMKAFYECDERPAERAAILSSLIYGTYTGFVSMPRRFWAAGSPTIISASARPR